MMASSNPIRAFLLYIVAGIYFGIVLTVAEINSWFRIQEMFHFSSFHMYGVLISAIVVAMVSVRLMRRAGVRDLDGNVPDLEDKAFSNGGRRYWMGGLVFGLGWGITGACPGPIYSLIGAGETTVFVLLASALLGAACYYRIAHRLPR